MKHPSVASCTPPTSDGTGALTGNRTSSFLVPREDAHLTEPHRPGPSLSLKIQGHFLT